MTKSASSNIQSFRSCSMAIFGFLASELGANVAVLDFVQYSVKNYKFYVLINEEKGWPLLFPFVSFSDMLISLNIISINIDKPFPLLPELCTLSCLSRNSKQRKCSLAYELRLRHEMSSIGRIIRDSKGHA